MKIIVIPHTHWDREWYFTNEVSDNFLKYNIDNFLELNQKYDSFYLDGQVSLLDDYLNHASEKNKSKIFKLIKNGKLMVGPLYTQPDVFNSLGETTLRNISFAAKILEKNKLPNSKIFYCPDTFGFGANFPQILKHTGFDKFVFWRGLPESFKNSDYNYWIGNNNSKLITYRYKLGYWKASYAFPWRELKKENLSILAKKFHDYFISLNEYKHYLEQAKITNNKILFPIGGDQIPFHPLLQEFFEEINRISQDEWKIGKFETFFENLLEPKKVIKGTIDYSSESKIHRTISTSRYDFKKLYRESEINLYHQLEPLEMYYKLIDSKYNINNDLIFKPLLCLQAHDVLGGCITDNTNAASKNKLINANEIIETKKAIILKQIATNLKLSVNEILIFNPNFDMESNNFIFKTIYNDHILSGGYICDAFEVHVLSSKKYKNVENCFKTELIFINKKIKPFSTFSFNFSQLQNLTFKKEKFNSFNNLLKFEILKDSGDLFDADWIDEPILKHDLLIKKSTITKFKNFDLVKILGKIKIGSKTSEFKVIEIIIGDDHYYKLEIINKFKNVTISWFPPVKMKNVPNYLQHLGIDEYEHSDISNWKKIGDADYPLDVKRQSGLIFANKSYICSSGTNLFTWNQQGIKIYLYRPSGVLGKRNLKSRPGVASGIDGHTILTPQGQMINEKLVFDFKYGNFNDNIHEKLNSFYKKPILFHNLSVSKTKSFIEKFIFIEKNIIVKDPLIKKPVGFISSSNFNNDAINFTFVNFNKHAKDFNKLSKKVILLK